MGQDEKNMVDPHWAAERIGRQMRDRRVLLGLSVIELAVRLGVTRARVYEWEAGRSLPKTAKLMGRWCVELGVELEVRG